MEEEVSRVVKNLLYEKVSPDDIKNRLVKKGFLESDIDEAVEKLAFHLRAERQGQNRLLVFKFAIKEIFDRIGYGFVSHPFLNILFWFAGGSYFLIGAINALRTVMSLLYSSFLKEFSKIHEIRKTFVSTSGIIYGFSFLLLALGVAVKSPLIYSLAFLAGSLGIVAHGEIYTKFLRDNLKREKRGLFLSKISFFGILITMISMLASGYIMDLFPLEGKLMTLDLFGRSFDLNVYGYLLSFEFTAFAFILSGYVLSRIKRSLSISMTSMFGFLPEFLSKTKVHSKLFMNNKIILFLTLTSVITGVVQVLGNSFYGIFIYNHFKSQWLGGFMNVAAIFSIAVIFAFIGPWFTRHLRHHIGVSPMLVFGTLLSAMLPLSLAYNPNLFVVGVATALSIIGSSTLGMAQGFFTQKLLSYSERQIYFSFVGITVSLPLLILSFAGAFVANYFSLVFLFKILIFLLVFIATPLYFLVVLLYERSADKNFLNE